ncbi:MAG: formylglycine-generating enzyme family protein [Candidatus Electryonea clarkiae]|nr:formylglycine-generating enzyme family protein [Candidatus Electryonea clarkiae]
MMGSPSDESGRDGDEGPQHQVTISSFQMMTTEVTQAQWEAVMGSNPAKFKGSNLPVEQVSWNDVQDFLKKLNQSDPGKGYRLPTEAEWEYACRAGTTTRYYSGKSESDLASVGWYNGNSGKKTHPVGQKKENAWGLYDMHGNVNEWCKEWYDGDYYDSSPTTDPQGASSGPYRVLRGGSWGSYARGCRSALRNGTIPDNRDYVNGFRVVFVSSSP